MKNVIQYILTLILSYLFAGCTEDFNTNLEPSLVPKQTTPSEASMTVSFSDYSTDKNWDRMEGDSFNFNINDFGKDQDWNKSEEPNSEFHLGGWSSDNNWNY